MREIGIRQLKQSLSRTLHEVEGGEQVRVTMRGRPIADIIPAAGAADGYLRELVASGRLTPPVKPLPRRAPRLAKGKQSASEIVLSDRDSER